MWRCQKSPGKVWSAKVSEILTPISPGELLDKLTILQIKCKQIRDGEKLANVQTERQLLQHVADQHIPETLEIAALVEALSNVNKELWDIEDDIRACERAGNFGPEFIKLARAVYVTNDKRADLKRKINTALGSGIVEEKSYAEY
ncbi:MAG: hypothetical protein GY947_04990 [Rhodobacteraceae bacterium]|nr:hypothetical protein [Paracoccaceae bacterium]